MATNGIEIEIKIPLTEDKFFEIKNRLSKITTFVKNLHQVDDYFIPIHRNFVEPKHPFEWLSIRKRGEKSILNYKHFHPEDVEVFTHCDELEVEVKNVEQLEKIFSIINLKKLITVEKERDMYNFNNEFEVALDVVKDLGYFIEIETTKDFGDVETARQKLFEFAKSLGIDISKTDKRGYPYLMMQKKGLIK